MSSAASFASVGNASCLVLGDVLHESVEGGDHLILTHDLHLRKSWLAVAVIAEAKQLTRTAPVTVAVSPGGDGLKHCLRDLRGSLCVGLQIIAGVHIAGAGLCNGKLAQQQVFGAAHAHQPPLDAVFDFAATVMDLLQASGPTVARL